MQNLDSNNGEIMSEKSGNPKDLLGINKSSLACVPCQVLAEVGLAMMEGRAKYGAFNFRIDGVRASVYYDATIRHLFSWLEGEDIDPDSGLSHVTKAITSLVVLRDAMMNGMVTDDRPPSVKPFYADMNSKAAGIVKKYADRNPPDYTIDFKKAETDFPWIEWHGGECPVQDGMLVDVEYRDGAIARAIPANEVIDTIPNAGPAFWRNDAASNDIIRYRIVS